MKHNYFFTSESITEGHPDKSPTMVDHSTAYGHFGKKDYPWEQLDQNLLDSLKDLL